MHKGIASHKSKVSDSKGEVGVSFELVILDRGGWDEEVLARVVSRVFTIEVSNNEDTSRIVVDLVVLGIEGPSIQREGLNGMTETFGGSCWDSSNRVGVEGERSDLGHKDSRVDSVSIS